MRSSRRFWRWWLIVLARKRSRCRYATEKDININTNIINRMNGRTMATSMATWTWMLLVDRVRVTIVAVWGISLVSVRVPRAHRREVKGKEVVFGAVVLTRERGKAKGEWGKVTRKEVDLRETATLAGRRDIGSLNVRRNKIRGGKRSL